MGKFSQSICVKPMLDKGLKKFIENLSYFPFNNTLPLC